MLKAARASVGAIFLIHGVIVGNWLSRIPAVQQSLHLSNAVLGLTLLASSAGAVVTLIWLPGLIGRFGSAAVTRWASIGFCLVLPGPAAAYNSWTLAAALFLYGLFAGSMDVAMNTQAVDVERLYKRPVMVTFHALFSLGGLIGSSIGGVAAARHLDPLPHLAWAATILLIATLGATRHLLIDPADVLEQQRHPQRPFPLRPLLALGVIAFSILLGEGAMADWSAVYLAQFAGQGTAATGYAAFSLAMAGGRFGGDWLRGRLGSVRLVRLGSILAALGLGIGLALGGVVPGLIGFACAGAGFSSIFPIALSAAGRKAMPRPEAGVATVTAIGYAAFLTGPPFIGFLSEWLTLRGALFSIAVLTSVCAILARFVHEADESQPA